MKSLRDDAPDPRPLPYDARWALFLDVDGTLLDHANDPSHVVVSSALRSTLARLSAHTDGALALVSGRSIADLDQLFAPRAFPAAGQHGLEIRDARGLHIRDDRAYLVNTQAVAALLEATKSLAGVAVEDKGLSVALHYRRAPYLRDRLHSLARKLVHSLGGDLQLIDGNKAFEIKIAHVNKGGAIKALMSGAPFLGRTPLYVGDDTTDEDGFAVVNGLNGVSVKVGAGESIAHWRASSPAEIRHWLASYADFLEAAVHHDRP